MINLLIVDDAIHDREVYRRYLAGRKLFGQEYVNIRERETLDDALALCRQGMPDCIILDYRLPDGTGVDFVSALSQHANGNLPAIVLVTGQGSEEVASEAFRSGVMDYLVKGHINQSAVCRSVSGVVKRRRLEMEVARYQRMLEQSNADLSRFANRLAHDLLSPISVIKGYAEMVELADDQKFEMVRPYLMEITSGADRLSNMIEALYTYSTLESEKGSFQDLDPALPLDAARSNLHGGIEDTGAAIEVVDALPHIHGDLALLILLFQNLIANAMKYAGDGPPSVSVSGRRHGRHAHLAVADRGIGVPDSLKAEIFSMFSRGTAKADGNGLGMGLATCQRIVDLHDGDIWCEDNPGGGSVFVVSLPLAESEMQDYSASG